jgi:asparagine synthase (glutamine-hydrolysing)
MSGIVGIFHRDGRPVDRELLEAVTEFLSYRGPDGADTWTSGSVGLGHTLLRTTPSVTREMERQPFTLDGEKWITADARLDRRGELQRKLDAFDVPRRRYNNPATDGELILRSYLAWGEDCLRHLRGDFAFGIWDAPRKTLFCGHDQLGVRPFYYCHLGDLFLFSNTLECLRLAPEVSAELNESAIADFLLFGLNCNLATTAFRDIRKLPPGHCVSVSPHQTLTRHYWQPLTNQRIVYRQDSDYVEHFRELLKTAVSDRIRTDRVGIWLSGGMDSSSIAAVAKGLSSAPGHGSDLRAYTLTYESLLGDQELVHARRVADHLAIPIRCLPMDDLKLFDGWDDAERCPSEPSEDPLFAGVYREYEIVSEHCRVVLSGDGGDELMNFQMGPYAQDLARNGKWARLASDLFRYSKVRSFPWRGIRQRVQRRFGSDPYAPFFPPWIAPDFARRLNLKERWRDQSWKTPPAPIHPTLPKAHASLFAPHAAQSFEVADAGVTHHPVEVRYPLLDLRIVEYLLALPPFPWFYKKRLLRDAMAGRLPQETLRRRKTPLRGEPVIEVIRRSNAGSVGQADWTSTADKYVLRSAVSPLGHETTPEAARVAIRPHCLNFWLHVKQAVRYNFQVGVRNA